MLRLGILRSQLAIRRNGKNGGSIPNMSNYINSWERTMSISTLCSSLPCYLAMADLGLCYTTFLLQVTNTTLLNEHDLL